MSPTVALSTDADEFLAAYRDLKHSLQMRLGDGSEAADIAQSCFERVYAHARQQPVHNPRALLFRTAENLSIDLARRRQTECRALQSVALGAGVQAACCERMAMLRQCASRLSARLRTMPVKRREIFLLVRLHGYTYAEAAGRLQISVAAVEKHMNRALFDCADLQDELPWVN